MPSKFPERCHAGRSATACLAISLELHRTATLPGSTMAGKIFISYRREDDPAAAARVRDALASKFGKANLFMDVDSLIAGQRFDDELRKALAVCDVLIAITADTVDADFVANVLQI